MTPIENATFFGWFSNTVLGYFLTDSLLSNATIPPSWKFDDDDACDIDIYHMRPRCPLPFVTLPKLLSFLLWYMYTTWLLTYSHKALFTGSISALFSLRKSTKWMMFLHFAFILTSSYLHTNMWREEWKKKSRHDFWQDFYRNCVCDFDFRNAKADLTNDAEWNRNRNYTLWCSEQCLLSRCAMMIWRNTFFFFKSHLIKEVTKQVVGDLSQ